MSREFWFWSGVALGGVALLHGTPFAGPIAAAAAFYIVRHEFRVAGWKARARARRHKGKSR